MPKGVYPYEYKDDLEKFNETSLSEKADFYSDLNKEDITDTHCIYAKRVCINFNIKILGKYNDLYVQNNTILLTIVFENFRNIPLKIYELEVPWFLTASGLAWKSALKETKVKFDWLTNISMLLTVEKGIRGGICYAIHWYTNARK